MYPCVFSNTCCLRGVFLIFLCSALLISLILVQRGSIWITSDAGNEIPFRSIHPFLSNIHRNDGPNIRKQFFITEEKSPTITSYSSNLSCNKKSQPGILLVITYIDEAEFFSIPLLHKLYSQDFPNIVFCLPAPQPHEHHYLPFEHSDSFKTVIYPMNHGLMPYGCLAEVIRRYPNSTGYFYIRNTVILNAWNLQYLNSDQIWESSSKLSSELMFHEVRDINWIWWSTIWGLPACETVYKELTQLSSKYLFQISASKNKTYLWDVPNSLNSLLWNGKGKIKCFKRASNIFYLPLKYSSHFVNLSQLFFQHETFADIAIPTMLRMIELEEKFETLHGVDLGDIYGENAPEADHSLFWKHFSSNLMYITPLILNTDENKYTKETRVHVEMLLKYVMRIREELCKENN